jgi:hypothetical protein
VKNSARSSDEPNGDQRESGETLTFWFEPNGDQRWPVEVDIVSSVVAKMTPSMLRASSLRVGSWFSCPIKNWRSSSIAA